MTTKGIVTLISLPLWIITLYWGFVTDIQHADVEVAQSKANEGPVSPPIPSGASCPTLTPLPRGYDDNARCDFHDGSSGHTTEKCMALKLKV